MLYTKDFYDLMNNFEMIYSYEGSMKKEDKKLWRSGAYYCNGEINKLFKAFMHGYSYHKNISNLEK
jgi:uncharacterized membrane protein